MVKIVIDAGHGIHTPGKRSPDDEREWSFNDKVAVAVINRLNQYQNVQILRTDDPTGKIDIPLVTRTNKANAWGADVLVSIHHNANTSKWGSWGGVETFVQTGASKASFDIANIVNPKIVQAMGLRNRGVKTSNLHMTRLSSMPAILTEGGFMDSTTDISALRDDSKLRAQGEAIADGLAEYFKLKPKNVAHSPTSTKPQTTTNTQGGVRMFSPTSEALRQAVEDDIRQGVKDGIINEKWLKQLLEGKLTLDDALALRVIIEQRRNK